MFKHLSPRVLAVYGVGFSFIVMCLSGIAVLIAPQGRLANQIHWRLVGLDRGGWEAVHNATAIAFMALGIWHLVLHWSVIRSFLLGSGGRPATHRPEGLAVLILVTLLVASAILDLPPASWVVALNEYFKQVFWGAAL